MRSIALLLSSILMVACGSEVGPAESNETTEEQAKPTEAQTESTVITPDTDVRPNGLASIPLGNGLRLDPNGK